MQYEVQTPHLPLHTWDYQLQARSFLYINEHPLSLCFPYKGVLELQQYQDALEDSYNADELRGYLYTVGF